MTKRVCSRYGELLSASMDGELSRDEAARLDAHLATCDACVRTREDWQRVSRLVAGDVAEVAPFTAAIRHRPGRRQRIARQALVACALALLVISAPMLQNANDERDDLATSLLRDAAAGPYVSAQIPDAPSAALPGVASLPDAARVRPPMAPALPVADGTPAGDLPSPPPVRLLTASGSAHGLTLRASYEDRVYRSNSLVHVAILLTNDSGEEMTFEAPRESPVTIELRDASGAIVYSRSQAESWSGARAKFVLDADDTHGEVALVPVFEPGRYEFVARCECTPERLVDAGNTGVSTSGTPQPFATTRIPLDVR